LIASIPTSRITSVKPSSFIIVPSIVVAPTSWSSPVVVPRSAVKSVSTTLYTTIASSPSAVAIDATNVPTNVPTSIIQTVPTSNIVSFSPSIVSVCGAFLE